jgi:crotonobetainyl-CoA:carnitine CoA-transferase CaiB-like acyl-CoA transferase
MTASAAGPLTGVTVLDLCSYLAGPYGCTLLADLGATVIKIESPQGDMLRQFPSSLAGESRFFLGTNRGKRALALDLKQPEGLAVLHRMVETADVLVENFRPSVPARLGIDYPRLKAINPRLVYCGLTGYGDSGPLSEKGGFDQVLQCLSGMAVFQGGGPDKPQLVLGSVLDYFTSALLAYGVAAALFKRERSGVGQYLSLSLLRSALTIQAGRFVWAESEGRDVARDSGAGGLTGIHRTKNGALYISVHSNHFFAALCELIGRPELARDPRCATMRSRAAHAGELVPELRAALALRSALEWEEIFGEARALRSGAADRGHVRSSPGSRRRSGRHARSSGGRSLSDNDEADQIRRHAGAAAVPVADLRAAQRRDPRRARVFSRRDRGAARPRCRAIKEARCTAVAGLLAVSAHQ